MNVYFEKLIKHQIIFKKNHLYKQVPDEKANMVGQLVRTNLDQKNVANQHLYKILP